ncbi:Mu transposase C-terminal domain-containing protein [Rhodoferax sp. BLA1]|uniref:Mu transposase C-terminal domain-containing protein n=1 Tax=Rhodoferax sp. BLA1 TaxID=2576062 RepID=UPI0015D0FFDE|nr:Mu transposase C-terminal domain-containing protein [Rhodoferax sp. BLA1]
MTSSLDAWKERCTLEQVRLPGDIDELSVTCCESDTRRVSHTGIELGNCTFNNSELQQLRRRVAPGGQTMVQLRYNTARMDRIWVQDPVTLHRFEVLNHDPATKDLSAKQVAILESIRHKSQPIGTVITRAQARKRMEDIYSPLVRAKTMLERRRALKILGLIANDITPEKTKVNAPKATSKVKASGNGAANAVQEEKVDAVAADIEMPPKKSTPASSPPKFKVVRQGSTRNQPPSSSGKNADAHSH